MTQIAGYDVARVGSPAPDFTLESTKNLERLEQSVSLSDYRGRWLELFSYSLDLTSVCPTEIIAFSDPAKKFRTVGAEFLGVSIGSKFVHRS